MICVQLGAVIIHFGRLHPYAGSTCGNYVRPPSLLGTPKTRSIHGGLGNDLFRGTTFSNRDHRLWNSGCKCDHRGEPLKRDSLTAGCAPFWSLVLL